MCEHCLYPLFLVLCTVGAVYFDHFKNIPVGERANICGFESEQLHELTHAASTRTRRHLYWTHNVVAFDFIKCAYKNVHTNANWTPQKFSQTTANPFVCPTYTKWRGGPTAKRHKNVRVTSPLHHRQRWTVRMNAYIRKPVLERKRCQMLLFNCWVKVPKTVSLRLPHRRSCSSRGCERSQQRNENQYPSRHILFFGSNFRIHKASISQRYSYNWAESAAIRSKYVCSLVERKLAKRGTFRILLTTKC